MVSSVTQVTHFDVTATLFPCLHAQSQDSSNYESIPIQILIAAVHAMALVYDHRLITETNSREATHMTTDL